MVMIFEHCDCSMYNVTLFWSQMSVHISIEAATKFLDYDGTIGDLNTVEFHERQLALGRAELHLVVHILQASVFKVQK